MRYFKDTHAQWETNVSALLNNGPVSIITLDHVINNKQPRLVPNFPSYTPGGGVLPEKVGGGVRHASWNPYPILDLIKNLIPYFRPDP